MSIVHKTSTGTNKMHETNALYLKTQILIAETHLDTHREAHKDIHRHTHTDTHKDTKTQTHRDIYKEQLQRFTPPFAIHMNLRVGVIIKKRENCRLLPK